MRVYRKIEIFNFKKIGNSVESKAVNYFIKYFFIKYSEVVYY